MPPSLKDYTGFVSWIHRITGGLLSNHESRITALESGSTAATNDRLAAAEEEIQSLRDALFSLQTVIAAYAKGS